MRFRYIYIYFFHLKTVGNLLKTMKINYQYIVRNYIFKYTFILIVAVALNIKVDELYIITERSPNT